MKPTPRSLDHAKHDARMFPFVLRAIAYQAFICSHLCHAPSFEPKVYWHRLGADFPTLDHQWSNGCVGALGTFSKQKQGFLFTLQKAFLLDWCDGIISTPALHRYVTAVIADNVKHQFLDRLKSIATTDVGKQAQKGLCDLLLDFCGMKDVIESDGESWCVPPSRYFSVIHKTSRASFETLLGANRDLLRKLWTDLFASADGQELRSLHPHLRGMEPEDLECVIPLVLFEDAAPYSKSKGYNAFSTYINETASNEPDEALWSLLFRDIELLYKG